MEAESQFLTEKAKIPNTRRAMRVDRVSNRNGFRARNLRRYIVGVGNRRGRLPVVEMPKAVFADWIESWDADEAKLRWAAIFGDLDRSQMPGFKKDAAI